jgi:pantoate--beta-alanine ligase
MKKSTTIEELQGMRSHWPRPVAFVPTMGALHKGHLALIRQARENVGPHGTVVVSIFVNPLQFDRNDDLAAYPRTFEEDVSKCEREGVDHLFHPRNGNFYNRNHSIHITEQSLSHTLCGATRPGHFDGVCTVVLKLLNLVAPDYAFFGKKDYQQLAIIRRLVRDLAVSTQISAIETLRESDGLAMSSRNQNLTEEQRADAPRLRKALLAAQALAPTGERNPSQYLASAKNQLAGAPNDFRLDYLELVSRDTLQPLATMNEPALLAIAAFYGDTRLIDNIELETA